MATPEIRKITASLPAELLERAMAYTGEGITKTLHTGLEAIARKAAYQALLDARRKFPDLHIDIDALREDRDEPWL